jgi:hypothetical protein
LASDRLFVGNVAAAGDPNAYFNALTSRGDTWTANSLRSQALIDGVSAYKPNPWVTYDSAQDAAKAVIPPFVGFVSTASVGADRITFSRALTYNEKNAMAKLRGLRVDNEIMTVINYTTFGQQFADGDTSVIVNRGQFGTAVASHAPGATSYLSQNSLMDQLRVPLGTSDGNRYLFTWDTRYDTSYLGYDLNTLPVSHKEFQLTAGKNTIWLETQTRADGDDGIGKVSGFDRATHVAVISGRYYADAAAGSTYSGLTNTGEIQPQAGRFFVRANVWTRFWWLIDQRAGDYDYCTLWVSDENTPPVKIFDNMALNARLDGSGVGTIAMWWLEQNTSYDLYRGSTRDLVSWTRNFVALRNPGDVTPLLLQPLAGVPSAPDPSSTTAPKPPTNLRIVTQ